MPGRWRRLAGSPPPAPQMVRATRSPQTPESRFVSVEGARIHYLRWGDPTRPGILLVHGNAAHAYWWSFIAPFLARDYQCRGDGPVGHGRQRLACAKWRDGGYTMDLFAREQMAVCEDAGMFVWTSRR